MASADSSWQALLHAVEIHLLHVHEASRGKTRFFPSIYLPHLHRGFLCSLRALACAAALPTHVCLMRFLFVRPEVCHPASFRFHLAMDTLAIGYALPAAGRARDFHPLEARHARHTTNGAVTKVPNKQGAATRMGCGSFWFRTREDPRAFRRMRGSLVLVWLSSPGLSFSCCARAQRVPIHGSLSRCLAR